MRFDRSIDWTANLEDAILRDPLSVAPNTPLVDAIAMISQAHSQPCLLTDNGASFDRVAKAVRVSCLLVMQDRTLLGILTERDVVRLTAKAIDFQVATVADVMIHPAIALPEQSVQDIFAALFLFRRYRIRHLPIVDRQAQLVGVISHESIRQVLRPANLLRFCRVSDVMTNDVIHAPLHATVLELAQLMTTYRVSCIVITELDPQREPGPFLRSDCLLGAGVGFRAIAIVRVKVEPDKSCPKLHKLHLWDAPSEDESTACWHCH